MGCFQRREVSDLGLEGISDRVGWKGGRGVGRQERSGWGRDGESKRPRGQQESGSQRGQEAREGAAKPEERERDAQKGLERRRGAEKRGGSVRRWGHGTRPAQ